MCKYYLFKKLQFFKIKIILRKSSLWDLELNDVWEARNFHSLLLGSQVLCPPAEASGGTHTFPSPPPQCKEEAVSTLDAVQVLAGVSQLLPKSRENYLNRCMDQERLRRESTSQKEMDKVSTWLQVPSQQQPMQVQGVCQEVAGAARWESENITE